MIEKRYLKNAFGVDEYGFAAVPPKYSNVQLSRIESGSAMGCSYCFPHGYETRNSHWNNYQRTWKKQRKTRYKA